MVGITVVGDDDYFIIVCLGSLNGVFTKMCIRDRAEGGAGGVITF